jgi:hypothetical protein
MALQDYGQSQMESLLAEMEEWSTGHPLERRAAAAAVCHPHLLTGLKSANRGLQLLDSITASLPAIEDRSSNAFRVLRQGLGYCWSVAIAAHPEASKAKMERWLSNDDRDTRWIMKKNPAKKRLERRDPEWVVTWRKRLTQSLA